MDGEQIRICMEVFLAYFKIPRRHSRLSKITKKSVHITDNPAHMRDGYLPNTSLKCNCSVWE